mmetsp:Transcript_127050/g.353798  ORF Transcript_127050/g.353798 Transcript_127050/m.353798 type:complete len:251 (-) Transcript_127050:1185-1937(-)
MSGSDRWSGVLAAVVSVEEVPPLPHPLVRLEDGDWAVKSLDGPGLPSALRRALLRWAPAVRSEPKFRNLAKKRRICPSDSLLLSLSPPPPFICSLCNKGGSLLGAPRIDAGRRTPGLHIGSWSGATGSESYLGCRRSEGHLGPRSRSVCSSWVCLPSGLCEGVRSSSLAWNSSLCKLCSRSASSPVRCERKRCAQAFFWDPSAPSMRARPPEPEEPSVAQDASAWTLDSQLAFVMPRPLISSRPRRVTAL